MARFCVGNRAAALSMVKHASDVQHTIEAGLLAAAAAGADGGSGGADGLPAVPPPEAVQRMRAVQSGYFEKGGLQPMHDSPQQQALPPPPLPQPNGQGLAGRPPLPAPPEASMKRSE